MPLLVAYANEKMSVSYSGFVEQFENVSFSIPDM